MHTNDERKSYTTRALTERGISQETQINQSFCHRNHDCPNKKKPQGCYAIPHSASEAEDDSMGKKRAEKKKRLVVVALFTQFQHLIFRLYDLSLRLFFFPTGGSKINICYNTGDSLSPIKCGQKTFLFSPFFISIQYSLGNFTYLKIIIDFLAIGFGSCGFWCRCKTHFMIHLYHVK